MTPLEAYNNCAEYCYAARYHSRRDGVSVTYVLARKNFWDVLPTVERMTEIVKEIRGKLMSGESTALLLDADEIGAKRRSPEVASLYEERNGLVREMAQNLDLPEEVLLGGQGE